MNSKPEKFAQTYYDILQVQIDALLKLILENAERLPVASKEIAKMQKLSEKGRFMQMITLTNREEQISAFRDMLLYRLRREWVELLIKLFIGSEKAKAHFCDLDSLSLANLITRNQRMLNDINEALGELSDLLPQPPDQITNLLQLSKASYKATILSFKQNLEIRLKSEPYCSNPELLNDLKKILTQKKGLSFDDLRIVKSRLLAFETEHIANITQPFKTLANLLEEPIYESPQKMADLAPWIEKVQEALKKPLIKLLRDNAALLPNVDVSTLDYLPFRTLVRLNKALDCNRILDEIYNSRLPDAYGGYIKGIQENISKEQKITVLEKQYEFLHQHKNELKTMFAEQMVSDQVKRRTLTLDQMYQAAISSKVVELKKSVVELKKSIESYSGRKV